MRFDNIGGNPVITKQENNNFLVVYNDPTTGTIQKYENLTFEEVSLLPFVDEAKLKFLK